MKNIPYSFFIFTLFFAPLAFGTVEQWSLASLEITTAVACALFFCYVTFYKHQTVKVIGLVPLVLLLAFMVLQIIPLPADVIKIISPGTYEIYSPLLAVQDVKSWIPLSVNIRETLHELLRVTSYALMYILTIHLLTAPGRLKNTANVVILLAATIAFFSIIQEVSSPEKIYWFRQGPSNAHPFGPWINPNQFAGYMEMMCPLAFALYLFYRPRVKGQESLREKIVSFFAEPGVHHHLYLGLSTVLMALAVFVSLCRGGILSLVAAGALFLFLYNIKFPKRGRVTLLALLGCIAVAVSWFGWDIIVAEFNKSFDVSGRLADGRLTLWRDVSLIIKAFPVFGTGFGTFVSIYPLYKTIDDNLIYDHAHNDYLELFTDGGVIGFLLAAWFVLAVLWHGWKMIRERRDQYAILIGIGAITGICAVLFHAITDFNMHNGAVGFYFFFLCGVLIAGVNCRFNYFAPGSLLKKQALSYNLAFVLATSLIFIITVAIQLGAFLAGYNYNSIRDIYVNKHLSENRIEMIIDRMHRALSTDPLEAMYLYKLGSALSLQGKKEEAFHQYVAACLKNPLDGVFLQQVGLLLAGRDEEQGKQLIELGYKRALNKDVLILNYVEWLLLKNHRHEALEVLRLHLGKDLVNIGKWMPLFNGYQFSYEEIISILPDSVEAWLNFASYCEKNRTKKEAEMFYAGALRHISTDHKLINPDWFMSVIAFYQRQGEKDKLVKCIRQALEVLPDFAPFHILLGDYYQGEGIEYRAKEEYERALVADPANGTAKSKLRRMGFADSY